MAKEKIVYELEVKADAKDLKKVDTQAKGASKGLKTISKDAKGAKAGLGGVGDSAGKAGGLMSSFGGTLGKLPGLFKGAIGMAKSFFVVLAANPIGLILTIIAALVGVVIAVFSKFKPITTWIADKLDGLKAMVDVFVNSLRSIGKAVKLVFQGEFKEAGKVVKDFTNQMVSAYKLQQKYNEVLRETDIQRALNDATTARAMSRMKELQGIVDDSTVGTRARLEALKELSAMKIGQAEDDYNTSKRILDLDIKDFENSYNTKIKSMEDLAFAAARNLQAMEAAQELLGKWMKVEVEQGVVAEENAKKFKDENRIRFKGLKDSLKLLKAKTAYYELTHQSILKGEKVFTEEMLKIEEERLNNIADKQIAAAAEELAIARETFEKTKDKEGNAELLAEAELKFKMIKINARKSADDEIINNQETALKQQLKLAKEVFGLWKEENRIALNDSIIETKKELDERIDLHRVSADKQIETVKETAAAEEWSKEKLATELLKVENDYTLKVESLNKSLTTNLAKDDKKRAKDKKAAYDQLAEFDKEYTDSIILKLDEAYRKDKESLSANIAYKNNANQAAFEEGLITEEEFQLRKNEIVELGKQQEQEIENNYTKAKVAKFTSAINKMQGIAQMFIDFNNAERDLELTQIDNKYKHEDEKAKEHYDKQKALLDKRLKDGVISEKKYNIELERLDKSFNKTQGDLTDARLEEENAAKKEAFDKNKKFEMAQVIMGMATGIMNIWATAMALGPVAGPITAGIISALITATGATQLNTIAATEYSAAGGGLLQGDLHAAGGINMGSVEAEGGEFIINRASTKAYSPLLNSINSAGNTNGDSNNVTPLIDYNQLADALQSKKVYVVSHDITDQQSEDTLIKDKTEF